MSEITDGKRRKTGIARLLEIAGTKKWYLILSACLAVIHAALGLVPYVLVYFIIKELAAPPIDYAAVWQYVGLAAAAVAASYAFQYASGMASHLAAFNILYELRKSLADKISKLPVGAINKKSSGAVKKILSADIERIENFTAHQVPDFVKGIAVPFITIGYLMVLDWKLGLASLLPLAVVVIFVPYSFIKKENKELNKLYLDTQEEMNGIIVEYVRAMPVVKVFNQTVDAFENYRRSVAGFRDRVIDYVKNSTAPWAIMMSFLSNNLLPILAVGAWLYFDNGLELSTFLFFLILGVGYVKPLFALMGMGAQLYLIVEGMGRMDEFLYAPEISSPPSKTAPSGHSVSFKNISFTYENGAEALKDVSFDVPEGSLAAFVGPSGAGKSTAAQLIARFWDVTQGSICIGGVDIRDMPIDELYRHVSFVFQDAFLFQDTVYENIRMGMDVSEDKVVAAAKAAQCHEFIEKLPLGYQTRVGEGGTHFSGGEQQRIMLARVVLKNAPIVVLDEATAFADPDNETKIQQAFGEIMRGKTVIVIAHRLSTITNSDRIFVFDEGKISASGTHEELLAASPLYLRMWEAHTRARKFELGGVAA